MEFGEKLSPTAAIASILSAYPFSVGLLRELLQNSDDSKASKQIFVLDSRTHPSGSIYDTKLADAQGPALLACNDALFSEADWGAIQTIYQSSKITDTSKIGKYGVGFRSCYHVTDNPQILSGSTLAIFDPHHAFTSSGGATFDFVEDPNEYADQLSGFDFFIPISARTVPFPKTIIRLPLRTAAGAAKSLIKKDIVEPSKIHQLLLDFVKEEIGIVLLFLTHITSIEIYEVNDQRIICLAKAELVENTRDAYEVSGANTTTYRYSVNVTTQTSSVVSQSWRVLHASYTDSEAAELISSHLGYDVGPVLQQQKLVPKVGIAMPVLSQASLAHSGRLYTYLPLPLSTGFPCHIHGLFALTPDRQHLRNGEETGVVEGVDSVLVAWNRILFDTFIPSAWAALLPILLTQDKLTSIFDAWPPSRPFVQGGDTMYWNDLPGKVLSAIVRDKLAVWPVINSNSSGLTEPMFSDLGSLLVASKADNQDILTALALAGISITLPPAYVKDLLLEASADFNSLNPDTACQALLKNVSQLSSLHSEPSEIDRILSYLLSTMDLTHIIGLPLVRVVNGTYVALKESDDDGPAHILLTESDIKVFGDCDENAIDVAQLPSNVAELLQNGSTILNVHPLTTEQVVEYIRTSFNCFNLDLESSALVAVPDAVIDWLVSFWEWFGEWPYRSELFRSIHTLCLVPTSRNILISSVHGVFDHAPELDMTVLEALEAVGISFLHPKVISRLALDKQGVIKSVTNGHHILDHILEDRVYNVKSSAASAFRNHILSSLANSRYLGPLDVQQQYKLRCLPIYPVLVPPMVRTTGGCAIPEVKPIADGQFIKCVIGIPIIPVIDDTVFLDGCEVLLDYLHGAGELLNADGILSLAVNHIAQQPKHLQLAYIAYIVKHRDRIIPELLRGLLRELSRAPFVNVWGDRTFGAPEDLFDPECKVAALLPNDSRCPRLSDDDDMAIVAGLRALQLLRNTLAKDIVEERIAFISQHSSAQQSIDLAKQLIRLIVTLNYDCTGLDINPDSKWLPTKDGLRGSRECHHRDAHPVELFDEVLPVVAVGNLSTSLVHALAWSGFIPLSIVNDQLDKVLQHGQGHEKLHLIIQELSKRVDLSSQDKDVLRLLTSDRPWIPISRRCIASTSRALLSSEGDIPLGFHVVPFSLTDNPRVHQFLQLMGCTERPTPVALLRELDILREHKSSFNRVKTSLRLLEALVNAHMGDEEHAQLLVPDTNGHLRPVALVYYNDLGSQAVLVTLPEGVFVAHPSLTYELAKSLRMTFIGHLELKSLLTTERDMGETLPVRIRNVLVQYTADQAFSEFFANAADAKATAFGIILDDQPAAASHVLSPAFAQVQSCPALIIYNNSVFDEKDFDGILNVGQGGKIGRSDTIGQFGLGALSMYHFTDVAMIVSGDKVMFLDPSRTYLPFPDRASASMTLSDIRRRYRDHLAPLCGLYGFSLDLNYYPGTFFRLPLRTGKSLLSPHSLTSHDLRNLIEGHYNVAPQTLLFTQVEGIKAEHRDVRGHRSKYWSIQSSRSQLSRDNACESQALCIRASRESTGAEEWHILSEESHQGHLPHVFLPLVDKYRLRNPIQVGFAAHLPSPSSHHKLFATMPLPVRCPIPVHLSAPFILAPDRRSIRLDGEEERYNRWLLSHLAPPLYLRLLEELLGRSDLTDPNWWRWWPTSADSNDIIYSTLVRSLYSERIAKTDRCICVSVVGSTISPRDAIFLIDANSAEAKLLLYLRPSNLVLLPSNILEALGQQIRTVDARFVKEVILGNVDRVRQAFVEGHLTVRDIRDVVSLLLKDGQNIVHLPLLPLASGTLATFGRSADTTCYYAWVGKIPSLFSSDRFVHPKFGIMGIDMGLNASKFDGLAAQDLIKDRIPVMAQQDNTTDQDRRWIDTFWSEFQMMNLESENISMFPLVPTTTPGLYISLQMCSSDAAAIVMDNLISEQELAPILSRLGAIVVRKDGHRYSLRKVLDEFPPIGVNGVLRCLKKVVDSSITKRFHRLSSQEHRQFANWGREYIVEIPADLLPIARNLPIWPALEGGVDGPFLAASDATMIPSAVGHIPDILRFLQMRSHFVEYSLSLAYRFKVEPMNFTKFRDSLNVTKGKILLPGDVAPYRRLLTIIIENRFNDSRDVLVPNSNRVLDYTHNLYARSQRLFCEAFDTQRDRLVHQDFQNLEPGLGQFSLRTEMDPPSFRECVRVIHEDIDGARRVERATLLYQWYCTTLPILYAGHAGYTDPWRELDSFRFIPPSASHRYGFNNQSSYVSRHIRELELLSPKEVLRAEHEAIAWTQRAMFSPSPSLLLADLSLGVPNPVEVLKHLRVLALQIAPTYPSNSRLLSDIKETYQWLETHNEDSDLRNRLIQYHTEPLFLNVDDPEQMEWTWHSADQLYLNMSDSPSSDCWGVRRFLLPFRGLLRLAGVEEVQMATAPDVPISSLEEQLDELTLIHHTYNDMRLEGKLTDVIFITDDGEEFPAHRVVLAGAGEHFQDLFLGHWGESNVMVDRPITVPECPPDCLRSILEYLYTGVIPIIEEQAILLHVLHLAHRWEIPSLVEAMQIQLIKHISLDTYDTLRDEVEELDAQILIEKCDEFERENQAAICRFKGD